jgi:hypothetical protein
VSPLLLIGNGGLQLVDSTNLARDKIPDGWLRWLFRPGFLAQILNVALEKMLR